MTDTTQTTRRCPCCAGTGHDCNDSDCADCNGTGKITEEHYRQIIPSTQTTPCHVCKGTGEWLDNPDGRCCDCKGKGYLTQDDIEDVRKELGDETWSP